MLYDLDETLRDLLAAELERTPGCPIYDADQITFDPPGVAEAALDREAHVNLYLHDVRENLQLRDEGFRVSVKPEKGIAGIRRPPVILDLSYLVTVYAGEEPAAEHRLLSDVLGVLLRRLAVPEAHLQGVLRGLGPNAVALQTIQPDNETYKDPPGLWQALGGRLRPALGLLVTAPFDPFETKWTRIVREAALGFGPADMQNGRGERPGADKPTRVSVAGIVLDQATEQPVRGADVWAKNRPDDARASTNERGFFFLLNQTPGALTLVVKSEGYREQEAPADVPPPGRPDQLQPVVVALRRLSDREFAQERAARRESAENAPAVLEPGRPARRASLSGRLLFPDGRPAAYVSVRAGQRRTSTDADGVYVFVDLPPSSDGQTIAVFADVPGVGEVLAAPDASGGAAIVPLPPAAAAAASNATNTDAL